jgi:hypothetical protein
MDWNKSLAGRNRAVTSVLKLFGRFMNNKTHKRNWIFDLLMGIIPVFLFILILSIRIPYSISGFFASYSPTFFLILLVLYFFSFRLSGKFSWLAGASLTMLAFGLTLSYLWNSGFSSDKIIGGLLPYRDGFDYYNGARSISIGILIPNFAEGAAWRPLYPGFLASLLLFVKQNLQFALAILVGLAGICYYLSAHYFRNLLGSPAAAVYMTLLYFYIQPLVGTAYTEILGLAFGCLGFILLLNAAITQKKIDLVLGLFILMIAVSVRAGTFFIFPALVVWAGWAFRGQNTFSWKYAAIALTTVIFTYLVANTAFNRLMVEPGGFPFGNFAFTIYGQVVGGAGYNYAFQELGVRNPALILRAAWRFFLDHPLSFFIGSAKAYRDFFLPQLGVFGFHSIISLSWKDITLWLVATYLTLTGLLRLIKRRALPETSLLITGFAGILLSIPFLPPIDGGVRIYASTIPFVYILPAYAIAGFFSDANRQEKKPLIKPVRAISGILSILTVMVPVMIMKLAHQPTVAVPSCDLEQVPFSVEVIEGSFIDLVPDHTTSCGGVPQVCISDFRHSMGTNDPSDMEVYNFLISQAEVESIRVFPADDMISGKHLLFVGTSRELNFQENTQVTGCATEIFIERRPRIYKIETLTTP